MKMQTSTQLRKTIKLKFKKSTTLINHHHHHHNSILPNLPPEILEEIFTRVSFPIKTITEFQNPTNPNNNNHQFSSIFSDPKFVESQSDLYTRPCILSYRGCHNKFFLIEGHHQNQRFLSMEINMDFMRDYASVRNLEILSSCNGLLLLTDRRILVVVNPLTQEIIHLPEASNEGGCGFFSGDKSYYAIGYSPNYETCKVVRLVGCLRQAVGGYYLEFCWQAEVLTLGTTTNMWRRIDGCDLVLQNAIIEDGGHHVKINGALFWLAHIGHRQEIVKFGIDSEEFVLMTSPLDELGFGFSLSSLGVVHDMLCVATYERTKSCNDEMELWGLGDCGVWKKISMISMENNNVRFNRRFEVIKASDENEEEVLMMIQDPLKLVYYNSKKQTVREAWIDGVDCCNRMKGVVFCPNLRSITKCIKI